MRRLVAKLQAGGKCTAAKLAVSGMVVVLPQPSRHAGWWLGCRLVQAPNLMVVGLPPFDSHVPAWAGQVGVQGRGMVRLDQVCRP